MTFNHKDLTAAMTEARAAFADARAAEGANRTSAAALRRSAVLMHEETRTGARWFSSVLARSAARNTPTAPIPP